MLDYAISRRGHTQYRLDIVESCHFKSSIPRLMTVYPNDWVQRLCCYYRHLKDLDIEDNKFDKATNFVFVGLLCFEILNIHILNGRMARLQRRPLEYSNRLQDPAIDYRTLLTSGIFFRVFEVTIGSDTNRSGVEFSTSGDYEYRISRRKLEGARTIILASDLERLRCSQWRLHRATFPIERYNKCERWVILK